MLKLDETKEYIKTNISILKMEISYYQVPTDIHEKIYEKHTK